MEEDRLAELIARNRALVVRAEQTRSRSREAAMRARELCGETASGHRLTTGSGGTPRSIDAPQYVRCLHADVAELIARARAFLRAPPAQEGPDCD
jgi:hypothetical protein